MSGSARALAVASILALLSAPVRAEDAPEPAPEALAQAWFDQLFGANTIEVWTTDWAGGQIVFAIARRWQGGRPEMFFHVLAPRAWDELNFLLRDREKGALELLYYRSPKMFRAGAKAARVMLARVPTPLERLPFASGLPTISDLQPPIASEYTFARLPNARVAKQACRVIEGRPHSANLGFDRVRYSLAQETGVALETVWMLGDRLVRRVAIDPSAVRDNDGRFLPTRRSVELPGSGTQVYTLSQLMLDPPFPDQLFTTQNLKAGRFPSY